MGTGRPRDPGKGLLALGGLVLCIGWAKAQDSPYYLRDGKSNQDYGGLNQDLQELRQNPASPLTKQVTPDFCPPGQALLGAVYHHGLTWGGTCGTANGSGGSGSAGNNGANGSNGSNGANGSNGSAGVTGSINWPNAASGRIPFVSLLSPLTLGNSAGEFYGTAGIDISPLTNNICSPSLQLINNQVGQGTGFIDRPTWGGICGDGSTDFGIPASMPAGSIMRIESVQSGGGGFGQLEHEVLLKNSVGTTSIVGLPIIFSTEITRSDAYFPAALMIITSSGVGIGTADPAGLFAVGASSLVVTQAGNVGIGTSGPTETLSVTPAVGSAPMLGLHGTSPQIFFEGHGGRRLYIQGGNSGIGLPANTMEIEAVGASTTTEGVVLLNLSQTNDVVGAGDGVSQIASSPPSQNPTDTNGNKLNMFNIGHFPIADGAKQILTMELGAANSYGQVISTSPASNAWTYINNVPDFNGNIFPPLASLHVNGDANGSLALYVSSGSVLINSTMTVIGNAFSVGGSTLVVISGNIGIGTNIPGASLNVVNSGANAFIVNGSTLVVTGGNIGVGTAAPRAGLDVYGGNLIGGATGTGVFNIYTAGDAQSTNSGSISIYTADTNRTPGGISISAGNAANVAGSFGGNINLTAGKGVDRAGAVNISAGPSVAGVGGRAGDVNISAGNSPASGGTGGNLLLQAGTGASSSGHISLLTAGSTTVYISGGNVGIATMTPTSLFMVGSATLTVTSSGNVGISSAAPQALFVVGNGTIAVTQAGNVGIGTTSPGAKLDVHGGSVTSDSVALFDSGGNGVANNVSVGVGGGGTGIFWKSGNALGISANGSEHMTILSGGNVGIGTTSPTQTFMVNGTAALNTTSGTQLYYCSGGTDAGWVLRGNTAAAAVLCTSGGGSLVGLGIFVP